MNREPKRDGLTVAGLFAGIGGIERGFHDAGHRTKLLCEIEPGAQAVLRHHFVDVQIVSDVTALKALPQVDVVTAGFPCQDLSQAGRTAGIGGTQSSLVGHVFRLIDEMSRKPRWLVLENVSFMLQLDRGRAMRFLVDELESRGFSWAYRVVDSRAFGVPQRRQRVVLVASNRADPRGVLFADDAAPHEPAFSRKLLSGFYWTEGSRGRGWAVDAVPTLKGGSTIGIPSPPGIWDPATGEITTPDIRDAERLQGFPVDWTLPALESKVVPRGHRWKLVGNAVTVPMAAWLGERLASPGEYDSALDIPIKNGSPWPKAAWGEKGDVFPVSVSMWPVKRPTLHLRDFLLYPQAHLSTRACQGFHSRASASTLSFPPGFLEHVRRQAETQMAAVT